MRTGGSWDWGCLHIADGNKRRFAEVNKLRMTKNTAPPRCSRCLLRVHTQACVEPATKNLLRKREQNGLIECRNEQKRN